MEETNTIVEPNAIDDISTEDFEALWNDETSNLTDEVDQPTLDDEEVTDTADNETPEEDGETDEAEQPESSDKTEQSDKPESKEPESETFKIKYMGEELEVNRDEVTLLAQKGKDYDRIRGKYDEFTAFANKHPAYEEQINFLNDLAGQSNMTVDKLIEETRIRQLVDQGFDEAIARDKYALEQEKRQLEREKAGVARLQQAEQGTQADQERRAKDIQEFLAEYPSVTPTELQGLTDVWADVANGKSLVDAYRTYENKQLKEQMKTLSTKLEATEKNKANKAKSTGSRATSGNKQTDALLEDWYSD